MDKKTTYAKIFDRIRGNLPEDRQKMVNRMIDVFNPETDDLLYLSIRVQISCLLSKAIASDDIAYSRENFELAMDMLERYVSIKEKYPL